MSVARKAALSLGVPAAVLAVAYFAFHEYVRAATFVVQAAGLSGVLASAADLRTQRVSTAEVQVPWRGGTLRCRRYSPDAPAGTPVLLVPGVHASGIDEPRLTEVARDLASVGASVVTVELPDLMRYDITPRSTDMIEDAALWLSTQPDLSPDGRLGIVGISFAGGLGIAASSRPSIRHRVAFAMSFGGHGDLPRTLKYLSTGVQPDGAARPPHDYGVAIILLGVADRVVPDSQVEPLRDAIRSFLEASRLDAEDRERSQAEFARARELAKALAEPARTLMGYVNERDVARLGPILLPHVAALAGNPALSPARSDPPLSPVYLLHGADDNVIPAIEAELLARELRGRGVDVHLLVTPLITHAEVDRPPSIGEVWELVRFWGSLFDR